MENSDGTWVSLHSAAQSVMQRLARTRRPTASSIKPALSGETNLEFLPALPTPEKEAPGMSEGDQLPEYADRSAGRELPSDVTPA